MIITFSFAKEDKMRHLALKVEPGVFDKFPEILVGGFLVGGLDEAIKRCPRRMSWVELLTPT